MPIVKIWGSGANIELNKKIVAFLKSVSELNIRGKNLVLIINPDHSSNQENVLFAEITILDIPEITRIERDTIATGVAHAIQSFFPSASIASTVFLISPNAGSCRLKSVY